MALYYPPTKNALQKTLDAQLDQGVTASATFNNTTGIQNKRGVFLVDRIDSNGNLKPTSDWEWISYTATSGSTVTTLTRGLGGSTDQDHAVGAIVEFVPDITWAQAILDVLDGTSTDGVFNTPKILTAINDTNGNELVKVTATTSAVNELTIANAATGGAPTISATGGDTDIDITLTPKGAGDVNLGASTTNIQVAGADPKRGIYIPAAALTPATTTGCAALTQYETSTNKVNYKSLDFDGATEEYAWLLAFQAPDYWDLSTITVRFHWTAASGSGDVIWGAAAVALSNDDALDTALGTAQTVTDTLLATGDVHVTANTPAITVGGTPAKGDLLFLRVYRDADAGGDTLAADAKLLGITLKYGVGQFDDQ